MLKAEPVYVMPICALLYVLLPLSCADKITSSNPAVDCYSQLLMYMQLAAYQMTISFTVPIRSMQLSYFD